MTKKQMKILVKKFKTEIAKELYAKILRASLGSVMDIYETKTIEWWNLRLENPKINAMVLLLNGYINQENLTLSDLDKM